MKVRCSDLQHTFFLTRIDRRNLVLNLFLALQNLSDAQYLPFPTSHEILLSDRL